MAGLYHRRTKKKQPVPEAPAPVIVLVEPQLGENIGACARAMLNCALSELRLVAPRNGWPNEFAEKAASGAHGVLENAQVYDTTAEAIADLNLVYASTARRRDTVKTILTPREAAVSMRQTIAGGNRVGVLFGPERSGLENDDVALAEAVIEVPLNPEFSSLNLAQAVLLITYELRMAVGVAGALPRPKRRSHAADSRDLLTLFEDAQRALETIEFFKKRNAPMVMRQLRAVLRRAAPSAREAGLLRAMAIEVRKYYERKLGPREGGD